MVIDHRHEHEIGAAIRQWHRLRRSLPIADFSGRRFTLGLGDHLLRWVDTDDLNTEMRGQQLGETSRTAAKVDDQRYCGSIDMNREQVLPEPSRFRCEGAGLVVGGRDLGLVVVHRSALCGALPSLACCLRVPVVNVWEKLALAQ